jgi:hypothetical protein
LKQRYAILFAGTALALASAPALAVDLLPPHEVVTILRSTSFEPISRPVRQGVHYLVRAVDRYGEEVRVRVDALSGRIRSVTATGDGPRYAAPAPQPYYGARVMPPPYYEPGPRVVRVLPDYDDEPGYGPPDRFYEGEPRPAPPRAVRPHTRAAAKPPLPRARPAAPAAVAPAPPVQEAPAAAPEPQLRAEQGGAAPSDGVTPPPVGFE